MLFFNTFDYGKSLLKQLEQLKKLPLQQQPKREQQILKAYEKFVQQYKTSLNNSSNPALLKTGAEALVEAAFQLREPRLAYQAYAEMVARSRKVPVVPGLAGLVDRMLELPTEQREERIALLSWRIVTGSMKPEKQLTYLAEKAELTGAVADWKDYSWNLSQLMSKGVLAANDPAVLDALANMLKNKAKLGDRLAPVQLLMAEAQISQGKYRQAEIQLTDLATEAAQLPEKFQSLVSDLVAKYPETNWVLQLMLLEPTVTALLDGKLNWAAAAERLDRARTHTPQVIEFLLKHPRLTEEDRLGIYVLERLTSLEQAAADLLYDRWMQIYKDAGREQPAGAAEVVDRAVASGHLTKRNIARVASIELGPSLLACEERDDVIRVLNTNVPTETLSAQRVDEINSELSSPDMPDWVVEESRLWLAERLARLGRLDSAARQLSSIPVLSERHAGQLYPRIAALFAGGSPPPQIQSLLARMSLLGGDYRGAFASAQQLPADNPARGQLLSALEEWILAQVDAPAGMLLVLAQTQRLSHGEPSAGLQAATTASLLAPTDENIQQAYKTWEHALAPEVVYAQRAHQATYLAEQHRKLELLPVALEAIEQLEKARGDEPSRESVALLEALRPLLLSVPLEQQGEINLRWARLYLMVHFKAEGQIAEAIRDVAPLVTPEDLQQVLGEFASTLPPNTRLQVEYEPAVRSGNWQKALELCQASSGELLSGLVSIPLFCEMLPASAAVDGAARFAAILRQRGDAAGELQLIQGMHARLASDSGLPQAAELREQLSRHLEELCQQPYEPAVRYRLEALRASGDLASIVGELLTLARTGDEEALADIAKYFEERLTSGGAPEQTKEMALVLAGQIAEDDPKRAVDYISRAGRAAGDTQWAIKAIAELELTTETAEGLSLIGELALKQGDLGRASAVMQRLTELGALEQAQKLADGLAHAQPDTPTAMQSLLLVQLSAQPRDMTTARDNLLKYVDMLREEGADISAELQPVATAAESAIGYDPSLGSLEFKLALALLARDQHRAGSLMQEITRQGKEGAQQLLALLPQLGVDADSLPSTMLPGYSRALFAAGRTDEALKKISALRASVEDYPEYISLLEEIKEVVGGADPSVQLGEAYLKVHLWERSGEEYLSALRQDPALADTVLEQLRENDALAPNPMKYPLHVAGLAAVATSKRLADWAWAISALSWLVPRWEPRELGPLTRTLWDKSRAIDELQPEERVALALQLHQLALREQDYVAALEYLTSAWELSPMPGPELQRALDSFDRGRLPSDPAVQEKLLRFEMQAALASGESERVLAVAQRLADLSDAGREAAAAALSQFQASADNPVIVLLQRMRMLDIHDDEQRSRFLGELAALAKPDLPHDQLWLILTTVTALLRQLPGNAELQVTLLQLLQAAGKHGQAWQLGLSMAVAGGPGGGTAVEKLAQAVQNGTAPADGQLTLAELLLARGEYGQAASTVLALKPINTKPEAAAVAEALLSQGATAELREWLVAYYRSQGLDVLAADHVLWAARAGASIDAKWLAGQASGEVLLRAAQLAELSGSGEERLLYGKALADQTLSPASIALGAQRLAGLAEAAGDLPQALELLAKAEATGLPLPALDEQRRRVHAAQQEVVLAELRAQPDSEARTLALAQFMRGQGDLPAAIAELQSGINNGQTSPEMYLELAEAFTANGDLNLGRRAFGDVLRRLDGADVPGKNELRLRANYGLAAAEEALGNLPAAVSALEDILVLSASYRDTRDRLNALYVKQRGGPPAAAPAHLPQAAVNNVPPPPAPVSANQDEILDEILALLDLPAEEAK